MIATVQTLKNYQMLRPPVSVRTMYFMYQSLNYNYLYQKGSEDFHDHAVIEEEVMPFTEEESGNCDSHYYVYRDKKVSLIATLFVTPKRLYHRAGHEP